MTQEEEQHKEERKVERANDRTHDRRLWIYPLVAVFISMFVAVGTNMIYTTIAVHRSEQSWCQLVTGLDNQNQRTPPPTVNGKVFARDLHNVRVKYHCK
jgi:hypothetical protein